MYVRFGPGFANIFWPTPCGVAARLEGRALQKGWCGPCQASTVLWLTQQGSAFAVQSGDGHCPAHDEPQRSTAEARLNLIALLAIVAVSVMVVVVLVVLLLLLRMLLLLLASCTLLLVVSGLHTRMAP